MTEKTTQKNFRLTREMVPIQNMDNRGYFFVCPLPKGYREAVEKKLSLIKKGCEKIVEELNAKAAAESSPFENILIEYGDITEDKRGLLKPHLRIERVTMDARGVYGVCAGLDWSSGDIYLATNASDYYDFAAADAFREFFENEASFQCHNVDFSWQALLTREFCIEYFNLLNSLFFQ